VECRFAKHTVGMFCVDVSVVFGCTYGCPKCGAVVSVRYGGRGVTEWAVENGIKINPIKIKAIRFTIAAVKRPLGYCIGNRTISEANCCK
jgi:hypothetical protein